jgi:hypothetical protein
VAGVPKWLLPPVSASGTEGSGRGRHAQDRLGRTDDSTVVLPFIVAAAPMIPEIKGTTTYLKDELTKRVPWLKSAPWEREIFPL